MKISLVCDLYSEKQTDIDDEEYEKLIKKNEEYIGKSVDTKIDRPLGCKPMKEHPDFVYELNYGFIPGTMSGDGEELDCYILGVDVPVEEFRGKCIAIVHRTNEDDDKLIIVPENIDYSVKEIEEKVYFSEKYHKSFVFKRGECV